jgi:hypothetical protein
MIPFFSIRSKKTVFTMINDRRIHSNRGCDGGNLHRHILKRFEAAFSLRPDVVSEGHNSYVEVSQIFDLGLLTPWAERKIGKVYRWRPVGDHFNGNFRMTLGNLQ